MNRINSINMMNTSTPKKSIKAIVTATFLLMVVINALANILPINGVTTGQAADSYPNLFAPAGLTFAIWGLIYIGLAAHTLYQIGFFRYDKRSGKIAVLNKIGVFFSISSIANAAWIFSWHYNIIPLSMLLMVVILVSLIIINQLINQLLNRNVLTGSEKILISLPFRIYFGWITVATIANATVLLVSMGWNGFGIPEQTWTVIIIAVGVIIGIASILKYKSIAYGLVIIWAYIGILIKHTSEVGFGGQYPAVIYTVVACIALLVIACAYTLFFGRKLLND